ncbi:PREDICTED: mimecan [Nanorana parkeri]|uniref:mimecan n=1 Tax=Nanorana parkeri TaxID=125878 RepID=UPI000854EAB6|nr:PREDICTED: mimecan [Nanorana parkeri]
MQTMRMWCTVLLVLPYIQTAPPAQQEAVYDYDVNEIFEGLLFKQHFEQYSKDTETNEKNGLIISRFKRDEDKKGAADSTDDSEVKDLPTCLACVCLSGSVYCEETEIEEVPPLPKETSYLYARFNKIKKITVKDFSDFPTLRRIDLTGNVIEEIEEKAFEKLVFLEQLSLAENRLTRIPVLPTKLTSFNVNYNLIKSKAVKANAFKKLTNLAYLYLANNQLESVPANLPESLRVIHLQNNNITSITDDTFCKANDTRYLRTRLDEVRMEGNPVILGKYPNSFTCLRTLPHGSYFK